MTGEDPRARAQSMGMDARSGHRPRASAQCGARDGTSDGAGVRPSVSAERSPACLPGRAGPRIVSPRTCRRQSRRPCTPRAMHGTVVPVAQGTATLLPSHSPPSLQLQMPKSPKAKKADVRVRSPGRAGSERHCQLQKALPCPNAPDALRCIALHRVACHIDPRVTAYWQKATAAARGVSA